MDSTAYKNLINELIPQGLAWNPNPDSNLQKLITGESIEFARLEEEAIKVLKEINPLTTQNLITEWVDIALGEHRCQGLSTSGEELKRALLASLASLGGSSENYFEQIALAAGYTITITDFEQFRAGSSRCGDRVFGNEFCFVFQVNGDTYTETKFRAGLSRAGDHLTYFSNDLLECVLNRAKPAHTKIIFTYS